LSKVKIVKNENFFVITHVYSKQNTDLPFAKASIVKLIKRFPLDVEVSLHCLINVKISFDVLSFPSLTSFQFLLEVLMSQSNRERSVII
jgi:hypothetical protein